MRNQMKYWPVLLATSLLAITVSADAGNKVPDSWRPYHAKHLELKPGCKMYQVNARSSIRVNTPGDEGLRQLQMEKAGMATDVFGELRTAEQARELCELLILGGLVKDTKSYEGLLKVHHDAGYEQAVESKDLTFDQIARSVEGGWQVEFTAFRLPDTMGAVSEVARYEFFVGKDASVKIKSTTYLKGVTLNWQTLSPASKLEQERQAKTEAEAHARVAKFVEDCYKHCSTSLPRIQEDDKGR